MDEIMNLISTVGFPVAISVAMFYFAIKFIENQVKQYADREEKLIAAYNSNEDRYTLQIDRLTETLNNFNITLTKIDGRLETLERKIDGNHE